MFIDVLVFIKERLDARIGFVLCVCIMQTACVTPASIQPGDLRKFTTDACTGYPEGPRDNPNQWAACCLDHDEQYWAGGKKEGRSAADSALRQCVVDSGASNSRARMMWLAVRIAGTPLIPSSFRWAYGWPYYRGFKPITLEEQVEIELKRRAEVGQ